MSDDAEVKADAPVPTKVRIRSLSHGAPSLVSGEQILVPPRARSGVALGRLCAPSSSRARRSI